MLHGHVVDELLDEHRLAHAGPAEEADLSPLGVGLQQVDDLDARLQDFHRRALLLKGWGLAVDALDRGALRHRAAAVDGLAQHVEHSAQGGPAYGHLYGPAGDVHGQSPGQPLAGGEHHAPDGIPTDVLGRLHDPHRPVLLHGQRLPQGGQRAVLDLHVHHGAGYLYDDSSFQIFHLRL